MLLNLIYRNISFSAELFIDRESHLENFHGGGGEHADKILSYKGSALELGIRVSGKPVSSRVLQYL